jgi:DNA-binding CsgD family transcriptional regulator
MTAQPNHSRLGASGPTGRAQRADAGLVRLSERDLALLRFVGEQYAITLPQLARLLGRSLHTARWLRGRWQRAGLAEGRALLVGQPVFVWLTRRGLRATGIDLKPWSPSALGHLPHIAAVNEARLQVAYRRPEARWVSERVLARELALAGAPRMRHRPDAEVVLGDQTAAVEVELTPKENGRTERIVAELLRRYDAVWYFAGPAARRQLERLVALNGFTGVQVIELPRTGGPR